MLFKESTLLLLSLISTWAIQFLEITLLSYPVQGCQPGKLRTHKLRGAEPLERAAKGNGNGSTCPEEPQFEKPPRSTLLPCLRTSSTAATSSSFRNWLSFAILSPFSRKFSVACSTEAAKTWAFLERPRFLLEGPLLLVLTNVVT